METVTSNSLAIPLSLRNLLTDVEAVVLAWGVEVRKCVGEGTESDTLESLNSRSAIAEATDELTTYLTRLTTSVAIPWASKLGEN